MCNESAHQVYVTVLNCTAQYLAGLDRPLCHLVLDGDIVHAQWPVQAWRFAYSKFHWCYFFYLNPTVTRFFHHPTLGTPIFSNLTLFSSVPPPAINNVRLLINGKERECTETNVQFSHFRLRFELLQIYYWDHWIYLFTLSSISTIPARLTGNSGRTFLTLGTNGSSDTRCTLKGAIQRTSQFI